jgi:hypothetical protein
MLVAPAWSSGSEQPTRLRSDALTSAGAPADPDLLLGAGATTPDAAFRPSDERDPAAPLPGTGVLGLLVAAAIVGRLLRGTPGGRPRASKWSTPHAPRAPPLLLTI